ncbi:MAG: PilN domain-containing protein [Proteobacteria bacterium]|nr:PilN domain-containing protein [Pseudomonadota bacterium]
MARINLLPWRAERREQRKREFFMQLGAAALAAIVVAGLWYLFMDARISNQNGRNDYLSGEIKQLDAKITEIKDLQKTKSQLLARKQIIEQLQENRAQMVHLFDELVKTIPDGARLTSLKQNNQTLTLDGVAQSNATVAEYMRRIEASPWLGSTDLIKTENKHGDSRTPYEFELVVHLDKPKTDASAAPAAAGSSGTDDSGAPAAGASAAPAASAAMAEAAAKPAAPASKGGAAQ